MSFINHNTNTTNEGDFFIPSKKLTRIPPPTPTESGTSTKANTPAMERAAREKQREEDKKMILLLAASKRGEKTRLQFANHLMEKLNYYMAGKPNIHTEVKTLAAKVLTEIRNVEKDLDDLRNVVKAKDKELQELQEPQAPTGGKVTGTSLKRVRQTPES